MLYRGFPTYAHRITREVRRELGLALKAPLDPRLLADALSIPVVALSDFADACPQALAAFAGDGARFFSAVTVFDGPFRLIVHNDCHDPGRQSSNIAHELAHGLLMHAPQPALDHRGCRYWARDHEEEANFLAGALLISDEAAFSIAMEGLSDVIAAARYGTTVPMVRYRLNKTGARLRAQRARRRGSKH